MGNEIAANLFLVGYAIQKGWMPVGVDAVLRAIEMNGVSVEMNWTALTWGRIAAADLAAVESIARGAAGNAAASRKEGAAALAESLAEELCAYQDAAYAARYRSLVAKVLPIDAGFPEKGEALGTAVARYFYKLLAYKDEYEVARLYSDGRFMRALKEEFEGDLRLEYHMAPPILQRRDPRTGRYPKRRFGRGTMLLYRILTRLRFLRGTRFDPFGYSPHRRIERALIVEYEATMGGVLGGLNEANYDLAVEIASYPELIRGYDTVKEEHLARAKARLADLLQRFFDSAPTPSALQAAE
jgi:indolepyruvate ferredoxin oxidoreductase